MSEQQRLENLETIVRKLISDVQALRAELRALGAVSSEGGGAAAAGSLADVAAREEKAQRGGGFEGASGLSARAGAGAGAGSRAPGSGSREEMGSGGPPPASQSTVLPNFPPHPSFATPSRNAPPRDSRHLESILARYGTLAAATLLVLMGVGAFVTWAVGQGLLGPTVRVILGVVAAAAVAFSGWRLRNRGSARFGDTLLALSLAIVHVDAWAAGPVLGLVPTSVALGVATLASVALGALAITESHQPLFVVGLGGALLAPFVTSRGDGSVPVLTSYGLAVIAASLAAVRERSWRAAELLLLIGVVTYTVVATGDALRAGAGAMNMAYAAGLPIACAWVAMLWGPSRERAPAATHYLLVAVLAALVLAIGKSQAHWLVLAALAILGSASMVVEGRRVSRFELVAGAEILPLGSLLAGLVVLPDSSSWQGAALAAIWAAVAFALATRGVREHRDWHLVAGEFEVLIGVFLLLKFEPRATVAVIAAVCVAQSALARRLKSSAALVPCFTGLVFTAIGAYDVLVARGSYIPAPFLTAESAAALAVVAAWLAVAWLVVSGYSADKFEVRRLAVVGACLAAFFWIRTELIAAIRPEIATVLLIIYYAVAGSVAIAVGRYRRLVEARRVGLVLALYAAGKAVIQASQLDSIGLKVGTYLLVGCFLLANYKMQED